MDFGVDGFVFELQNNYFAAAYGNANSRTDKNDVAYGHSNVSKTMGTMSFFGNSSYKNDIAFSRSCTMSCWGNINNEPLFNDLCSLFMAGIHSQKFVNKMSMCVSSAPPHSRGMFSSFRIAFLMALARLRRST